MYPTDIAFYYALKLGHFFKYFFQRVWPGALAIPGYASAYGSIENSTNRSPNSLLHLENYKH
jgi:hypothetical protein